MTRNEAATVLHKLKWLLADEGYTTMAGAVEDAEHKIFLPVRALRYYADFLLPPGKRGRIHLVLLPPYEARALALIAGILRSIGDDLR